MIDAILILLMGLALTGVTGISLSFFISSIREEENRAMFFGGVQFAFFFGSLVLFFIFYTAGLFETPSGRMLLMVVLAFTSIGTWLLFKKSGENGKALEGTAGLMVGEVKRFDERETVFCKGQSSKRY
jgi:hypothetical protein